MTRPRLLDLFCGAGGAAMGYHRAGFDVTGVDIRPQPNYPFEFHQADALTFDVQGYDVVHASPPCQAYTALRVLPNARRHPDLLTPTLTMLRAAGVPWVVENVPGAPLPGAAQVCGSGLGLNVWRHRLFQSDAVFLFGVPCRHPDVPEPIGVWGTGGGDTPRNRKGTDTQRAAAMGVDWMSRAELAQAIPPAYTEHIGAQLMARLGVAA